MLNRLKQYIARCLEEEIPKQERLVLKILHATLYLKKHKSLDAYVKDAIDLDDSCDVFQDRTTQLVKDQGS